VASVLLLSSAAGAQGAATPPQCYGSPLLQVEVADPPSFAGNCSDLDGDNLTITITQQPQKGTAAIVGQGMLHPQVEYSASALGADSFKFKASDGSSESNEVTVTTDNVPAVNDPPQCWSAVSGDVGLWDPPVVAGYCLDDEHANLTIAITQQPQKGTVEVVGQGTQYPWVKYSATAVGADSFKFKANDGSSDSNEVTVTTNNVPGTNDPPQCDGSPVNLDVEVGDPPVYGGACHDEERDNLTITITQQPQKGTAEVVSQGTPAAWVQYSATAVGADSFKFKANDGTSDSNEATVTTTNTPTVNDPPRCYGPSPLEVEVGDLPSFAGSCFDEEGDEFTITITGQPQKGTAEVVTEGVPPITQVRYSATSVGADSFKFKASAGTSGSNEVTVTTVNVDTTPPQTTIEAGPTGPTGDASPTFEFSSSESGSSFECRVDERSWQPCSPPVTLAALSDGPHKFEVRGTDQAGNTDESPDSRSFTVETTALAARPGAPAPGATLADETAPSLRLGGATLQKVLRQRGVFVVAACPAEACTATAKGRVAVRRSAKVFKLIAVTEQIAQGGKAKLKLKLEPRALRALERALRAGKRTSAKVTVTVKDAAGNVATKRRTIRLKP
jgi:uncharacterized protein YggU (UPF0235/DUF167 family)